MNAPPTPTERTPPTSKVARLTLKDLIWAVLVGALLGGVTAATIAVVSQLSIGAGSAVFVLGMIAAVIGAILGALIALPASLGASVVLWALQQKAPRWFVVSASGLAAGAWAGGALFVLKDLVRINVNPWFIAAISVAAVVVACVRIAYRSASIEEG